jgi:hypothetical protein
VQSLHLRPALAFLSYKPRMNFQAPEEFIAHLQRHLAELYRPMAGAVFSIATVRGDEPDLLITGRVIFFDGDSPTARPGGVYPTMTLAEEVVTPIDSAVQRLRELLHGETRIAADVVKAKFLNIGGERRANPNFYDKHTGWPEWVFTATWHHQQNRPQLPHEPVVAFGLPPHMGGERATAEWVFGEHGGSSPGGARHQNELIIVVPDTRGRIVTAEWTAMATTVTLEINCPAEQIELQTLFHGSRVQRDTVQRAPPPSMKFDVPNDSIAVWHTLVHASNDRLGEVNLSQVNRVFDDQPKALPVEERDGRRWLADDRDRRI